MISISKICGFFGGRARLRLQRFVAFLRLLAQWKNNEFDLVSECYHVLVVVAITRAVKSNFVNQIPDYFISSSNNCRNQK
jgi:hypothetical protein